MREVIYTQHRDSIALTLNDEILYYTGCCEVRGHGWRADNDITAILASIREIERVKGEISGDSDQHHTWTGALKPLVGDGWTQRVCSSHSTCEGVALTSHWGTTGGHCGCDARS